MDGKDISDSRIGPYNEGQELRLLCESGGGKPIPRVTWYNGSEKISGKKKRFTEVKGYIDVLCNSNKHLKFKESYNWLSNVTMYFDIPLFHITLHLKLRLKDKN